MWLFNRIPLLFFRVTGKCEHNPHPVAGCCSWQEWLTLQWVSCWSKHCQVSFGDDDGGKDGFDDVGRDLFSSLYRPESSSGDAHQRRCCRGARALLEKLEENPYWGFPLTGE